jgi:diguanylate cyclase (GGDEF)-like protein
MSLFSKNLKDRMIELVADTQLSAKEKISKLIEELAINIEADIAAFEKNADEMLIRSFEWSAAADTVVANQTKVPFFCSPCSVAYIKLKPIAIQFADATLSEKFLPEFRFNANSYLGFPIFTHGDSVMGVLSFYALGKELKSYPHESVALACHEIASLLEIDRLNIMVGKLNNALENISMVDNLTGTLKRNYLSERLELEMKRAMRYERPLSCILVDIVNLYQIFNKYGNKFANSVVKDVSDMIRATIRKVDAIFRYGGKEFFLVLPETKLKDAFVLSERIRELIDARRFTFKGLAPEEISHPKEKFLTDEEDIKLEIEVGYSSYPSENVNTALEMIRSTDQQLMMRKNENQQGLN